VSLRGSLSKKSDEQKEDAGGIAACIIIRGLASIIEFQSQLYVPWGLGTCDLADRRPQRIVRCVVLDVVKCVDEVAAELQAEAFRQLKVLVQTRVDIEIARRTQTSKLR